MCVCTKEYKGNARKKNMKGYIVNIHKQDKSRNFILIAYEAERAHIETVPVNVLNVKFII